MMFEEWELNEEEQDEERIENLKRAEELTNELYGILSVIDAPEGLLDDIDRILCWLNTSEV